MSADDLPANVAAMGCVAGLLDLENQLAEAALMVQQVLERETGRTAGTAAETQRFYEAVKPAIGAALLKVTDEFALLSKSKG